MLGGISLLPFGVVQLDKGDLAKLLYTLLAVVLVVALIAPLQRFAPLAISIAGATLWAHWPKLIKLLYRQKKNIRPLVALWLILTPADLTARTSLLPDADTLVDQDLTPFRSARSGHINELHQLATAVHILEYAVDGEVRWADHLPIGKILEPFSKTEDDGGKTIDSTLPFGLVGDLARPLYTLPKGSEETPQAAGCEEEAIAAEAETQPAIIFIDNNIPPGQHTQEKRNSTMADEGEEAPAKKTRMGATDGDVDDIMDGTIPNDEEGDYTDGQELREENADPTVIERLNLSDPMVQLMMQTQNMAAKCCKGQATLCAKQDLEKMEGQIREA